MRLRSAAPTLFALALYLGACGDGATPEAGTVIRTDTIGDTIVVRSDQTGVWEGTATLEPRVTIGTFDGPPETVFGSVNSLAGGADGEVYVLDRQAIEIRVFDRTGTYLRTIGREGGGPGEMGQPMSIGVYPDGRVGARDPQNGRLQLWTAEGEPDGEWPVVSPRDFSGDPLWVDEDGRSWVVTKGFSTDPTRPAPNVVVRVDRDGTVLDTLSDPGAYAERPEVTVSDPERGTLSSSMTLPFFPGGSWAVHPSGAIVRTTSDGEGVEMVREDGTVRRYVRAAEPVPIPDAQRMESRRTIEERMRDVDPSWRWDGPDLPLDKPHAMRVWAGEGGRIWTMISTPSRQIENPFHDPEMPGSRPMAWTQPVAFDVFEADGTYLGRVDAPEAFVTYPAPVFFEDGVWATTRDDLGVQRVVWWDLVLPRQ